MIKFSEPTKIDWTKYIEPKKTILKTIKGINTIAISVPLEYEEKEKQYFATKVVFFATKLLTTRLALIVSLQKNYLTNKYY